MYTFDTYKYFIIFAFDNFEMDVQYPKNKTEIFPKIR